MRDPSLNDFVGAGLRQARVRAAQRVWTRQVQGDPGPGGQAQSGRWAGYGQEEHPLQGAQR